MNRYESLIEDLEARNDLLCNEAATVIQDLIKAGEAIIKVFDKFGKACDDLVKEVEKEMDFK